MTISRDEVLRIAELARLEFDAPELDAFTAQFQHILDYIEKLEEVDVEGIEPTSSVGGGKEEPRLRADAPQPSLPVSETLRNAPDQGRDLFRVPNVLK